MSISGIASTNLLPIAAVYIANECLHPLGDRLDSVFFGLDELAAREQHEAMWVHLRGSSIVCTGLWEELGQVDVLPPVHFIKQLAGDCWQARANGDPVSS